MMANAWYDMALRRGVELDALREENARLRANNEGWRDAWAVTVRERDVWREKEKHQHECARKAEIERDDARAETSRLEERNLHNVTAYSQELTQRTTELQRAEAKVSRLEGLILEAESDIKAMGTEAHPAVLMRLDRLVRRIRAQREEEPLCDGGCGLKRSDQHRHGFGAQREEGR